MTKISRSIRDFTDETRVAFNIWQKDKKFFDEQIVHILQELKVRKEYQTLAGYYEDNNDPESARKYYRLEADKAYQKGWYESAAEYYEKAGEQQLANDCYLKLAKKYLAEENYEYAAAAYAAAGNSVESCKLWLKHAEDMFQKGAWRRSDYDRNKLVNAYKGAGLTDDQINAKFAEQEKLDQQKEAAEIEALIKAEADGQKLEINVYIQIARFYEKTERTDDAKTYWLKAAEKYSASRQNENWEFELKDLYYHAGLNERDMNLRLAQIYDKNKAWGQAALKYSEIDDEENAKRCWLMEANIHVKQKHSYTETARAYSNGGDKKNANKYYLLAAEKREKYGKSAENYDELYQAAALYDSGGNHNKAKKLFQLAAEGAYKEGKFALAANAYSALGNHEKSKECLVRAAKQMIDGYEEKDAEKWSLRGRIQEAKETLKRTGMDEKKMNIILAETLETKGYYREAAQYHEDENRKKECLKQHGDQLAEKGKIWDAARAYDNAGATRSKTNMLTRLADEVLRKSNYFEAERYYKEAGTLNEQNLEKLIAAADTKADFATVARLYEQAGEDEKAKEFHIKAAKKEETNGWLKNSAYDYRNAARHYEKAGQLKEAKRCDIEAIKIYMANNDLGSGGLDEYCELTGTSKKDAELLALKFKIDHERAIGWRWNSPDWLAKEAEELGDYETALDLWDEEYEDMIKKDARNDKMNDRLGEEDSAWNLREKLDIFTEISRAIGALERASDQQLTVIFPQQHFEQPPQHQM